MRPELQRRVQRYGWDYSSPYYEQGWQRQLWPAQQTLLDKVGLKEGDEVLDISCGTGLVTFPIAEKVGGNGSVTGIDLSEGMIEKASSVAEKKSFDNVSFKRMDAEDLQLPEITYDVAVNSLGLMYYPNPEKSIEEMYRVLKLGGRAAAMVWGRRKVCGWASIFPIVDRRVKTDVCPLFFQLGTDQNLANNFGKAGFCKVESYRLDVTLDFDSEEEAIISAFLGGAVAMAYRKFDEETKEKAHQEYLESIQQYSRDEGPGYEIPGEFVIVTGLKS